MARDNATVVSEGFVLRRRLPIDVGEGDLNAALGALGRLPGMVSVRVRNYDRLVLKYDASQIQIDQIVALLTCDNILIRQGYWQRLRLGWYRFVDQNSLANAQLTRSHCCNKPPKGY